MDTENYPMPVRFPISSAKLNSVSIADKQPVEEYIKRSDIRKEFQRIMENSECTPYLAAEIGVTIELLSPSDVVPTQYSHWIKDTREIPAPDHWFFRLFNKTTKTVPVVTCSNCGTVRKGPLKYCSNCGCKMNKKVY